MIEALARNLETRPLANNSPSSPQHSVFSTPLATNITQLSAETSDYFASCQTPQNPKRPVRPRLLTHPSRGRAKQRSFLLTVNTPVDTSPSRNETKAANLALQHQCVGWPTRTYLIGLILPGESMQHLLVSSLLENSPEALAALGDTAILDGGFVYKQRSSHVSFLR